MGRGPTKEYHKVMNESFVEGTLTCLKPETIVAKISTDFPLVLNVEPTNACNSQCYYCPRKKMIKEQGVHYLKFDDFKMIIDQIGRNKLIMLNLHKDGEPLLNKSLPDFIAYAHDKNAAEVIHLNTNGILLDSPTGRGIIEQQIEDITVSVDAVHEETYQKLKGVKGIDKLERNILKTLEYRDKCNSRTKIRLKIMEFDDVERDEVQCFIEKWTGVADEVQVTGVHSWSGAIEDIEVTDEKTKSRYSCALLWYMLAINSNGKVSVCNVDWDYSGVVGNIKTNSIKEIWNGKKIKAIRQSHLNNIWNKPPVCKECVVWVSVGNVEEYLKINNGFV